MGFFQEFADNAITLGDNLIAMLGEPNPPTATIESPNGKGEIALVRTGYTLQKLDGRMIRRRKHVFEDVDSLAAWLARQNLPAATEILVDETVVGAMLAPADPNGDDVTCPLKLHPRAARWMGAAGNGKTFAQRELQLLVLSSLDDFLQATSADGKPAGSYGEFLAGEIAKFGLARAKDFTAELDPRGFVTFTATSDKVTVRGSLPPFFDVKVPIYLGIQNEFGVELTYKLRLYLQVEPQDNAPPTFQLDIPDLQVVLRQARLDAAAHLRRKLDPSFLVGLGKLQVIEAPEIVPAPRAG